MKLTLLDETFTLHRLASNAEVPAAALGSPFFAIMRTDEELSLVLPEGIEFESEKNETGWACFKVEGPLEFGLVGYWPGFRPRWQKRVCLFLRCPPSTRITSW